MPIKTATLDPEATELPQATPEQIRDYANNFLNLDAAASDSDDTIRSMVLAAQPGNPTIFYQEEAAPAEATAPVPSAPGLDAPRDVFGKGDPRAVIFIPVVEAEGGSNDVPVGVNGRAWLLKRGCDLPVPWRVVVALQNAVADVITHRQDQDHVGDVEIRSAERFPFMFKIKPSDEEIADWHVRDSAVELA